MHALNLRPDFAEALSSLGNIQRELGQFEAAVASHQRALILRPDLPEIAWNYALCALVVGDFAEGWRHFERRLDCPGALPRAYPVPRWDGRQSLHGKKILLYPELGFGDTINFIRFAPQLKQRGAAAVVVECQPSLRPLLQRMVGIDQVVATGEALPSFDTHLALIDLLPALNVGCEALPESGPYLTPPNEGSEVLSRLFAASPATVRKVGLVWAGESSRSFDRDRSVAAAELLTLADIPGHWFYALQKDKRPGDDAVFAARTNVTDLAPLLTNFDDTAWAVSQLDLVISVDTAVAHLAGALGKPTWLLLRYASDWRYPINMNKSLWYSSMRIFRQKFRSEWRSTVAEVAAAFEET
jgi:hypothetical protein